MSRQVTTRIVRPILSRDTTEARKAVFALYRDLWREMPWTVSSHSLPITVEQARAKLKSEFLKHKDVTDIRVIDMLAIKGRMTLEEMHYMWAQDYNVMNYFESTDIQKQKVLESDLKFLDKFYKSSD